MIGRVNDVCGWVLLECESVFRILSFSRTEQLCMWGRGRGHQGVLVGFTVGIEVLYISCPDPTLVLHAPAVAQTSRPTHLVHSCGRGRGEIERESKIFR